MERANPFDDLGDFTAASEVKPVEAKVITRIAEEHGFPSRQPAATVAPVAPTAPPLQRRRYTTGRNQQINLKATPETVARFYKLANANPGLPLGELFEQAVTALEQAMLGNKRGSKG